MEFDAKSAAQNAIRRSLRGLVRLGLRAGVSVHDFEEVVREAYFQCARDDYGLRDRPTNLARVAVLTGLSRKECGRLKQKAAAESANDVSGSSMNPATRVMTVWATDPRYSDGAGPRLLRKEGAEPSLKALIAEHVGDIPQGAVIAELNRVGALQETSDGMLQLVQRSFLPAGMNAEKLRILANQYEDLGSTVVFNLDEVDRTRLQRYVVNDNIPADRVHEFQELTTALAQSLLERLDRWLSNNEVSADDKQAKRTRVRTGLGMYFFET